MERIKLLAKRRDLEGMMYMYTAACNQLPELAADDDESHERLLLDHALEMREELVRLWDKRGQKKFTIPLKQSEVRAMYQMWRNFAFDLKPFEENAVNTLLRELDRATVSANWVLPRTSANKALPPANVQR